MKDTLHPLAYTSSFAGDYKFQSRKWRTLLISEEKDKEIEDIFDPSLRIRNGQRMGKEAFANFMARYENKTPENFKGFEQLLERILEAAKGD